jgi:hypothetical protein
MARKRHEHGRTPSPHAKSDVSDFARSMTARTREHPGSGGAREDAEFVARMSARQIRRDAQRGSTSAGHLPRQFFGAHGLGGPPASVSLGHAVEEVWVGFAAGFATSRLAAAALVLAAAAAPAGGGSPLATAAAPLAACLSRMATSSLSSFFWSSAVSGGVSRGGGNALTGRYGVGSAGRAGVLAGRPPRPVGMLSMTAVDEQPASDMTAVNRTAPPNRRPPGIAPRRRCRFTMVRTLHRIAGYAVKSALAGRKPFR